MASLRAVAVTVRLADPRGPSTIERAQSGLCAATTRHGEAKDYRGRLADDCVRALSARLL